LIRRRCFIGHNFDSPLFQMYVAPVLRNELTRWRGPWVLVSNLLRLIQQNCYSTCSLSYHAGDSFSIFRFHHFLTKSQPFRTSPTSCVPCIISMGNCLLPKAHHTKYFLTL